MTTDIAELSIERQQIETHDSDQDGQDSKTSNSKFAKFFSMEGILTVQPPTWTFKLFVGITLPILTWMVAFVLFGDKAVPGGQIFAILVLEIVGIGFGHLFTCVRLPPLLGMLTLGIFCRNIPSIDFGNALDPEVSSILRQTALTVILIRAGLGLDPVALMRLKGVVIRLAFLPCVAEAATIAVASYFILEFPIFWGLLLGFVLAAVSPAVIVPSLLQLSSQGYGLDKGIPTIVIAASSVDDILAISAFGIVLGFTFSQGNNIISQLLHGPLEVLLGLTFGIVWGILCGVFASTTQKSCRNEVAIRVLLTLGGGLLAVFGFPQINYPGAGALGCLTAAFVTAVFWRRKGVLHDDDDLSWAFSILWIIFQPLLFGLIGCEIDLWNLDWNVVCLGTVCLIIGLTVRLLATYLATYNAGLNFKERLFVAIAWVPKATVQAAIGPIALDTTRKMNGNYLAESLGLQVLTIAVLVILITAPIGATAVMALGPKLLHRQVKSSFSDNSDLEPQHKKYFPETNDNEVESINAINPLVVTVEIESQQSISTNNGHIHKE